MSVPQWNADIITPDAPASDTPIATNGGLEKNQSGELGVSVDGSTVTINGDGQLESSGLPDSSGASQGDVLTVGSSGPEWAAPQGGGSDLDIMKSVTYATPDGKELRFNISGDITTENYGNTAITSWQNGGSIGLLSRPWDYMNSSTTSIELYTGTYVSSSYHLAWYPNSNGNVYARYKVFNYNTITSYYIYDGTERRYVGTGYSYPIPAPPGPNPVFDTSLFDLVGDWSTVVAPITDWGLAFVDTDGNIDPSGLQYSKRDTTWSIRGRRPAIRLKTNGGLTKDPVSGLYVTVPVPSFNTTNDVGKVLQVTANGLAWVTPA